MATCTKCKEEIESLEVLVMEHSQYEYRYDKKYGEDWNHWDCDSTVWKNLEWRCPKCHIALPINGQDGANSFLTEVINAKNDIG